MTREQTIMLILISFLITFIIWQFVIFLRYKRYLQEEKDYYKRLFYISQQPPPKIIKETVPLSVIEARQYVPAEQYLHLSPEAVKRDMERLLSVKIGEEIVKACGVKKGYNQENNLYVFRVAVEVTERSLRERDENENTL